MPVKPKKVRGRWRVVEADSERIAKNKAGTAVDGGGHHDRAGAQSQSSAINASLRRRGKI